MMIDMSTRPSPHITAAMETVATSGRSTLEQADALVELALGLQAQPRHVQDLHDALHLYDQAMDLTKDEPIETVIEAIRMAVTNGAYFSPRVRSRLVVDPDKGLTLEDAGNTKASTLTPRELEVLRYLARGMSKKEIAGQMYRSISTVDKHVENLMRKLGIHDRVEIARYAIREGLVEP